MADPELVDLDDVLVLAFGVNIVEGADCCDVILLSRKSGKISF